MTMSAEDYDDDHDDYDREFSNFIDNDNDSDVEFGIGG